nr:MAG TPA: hypothetical protein [Caudoviricetes sp.]
MSIFTPPSCNIIITQKYHKCNNLILTLYCI